MDKMSRWLEVNTQDGIAFHERYLPENMVPPAEVFYCDCDGTGRETWNPQVKHADYPGLDSWKSAHQDCGYRRQIFVNVTKRPDAKLGMQYDEKTDTFSEVPPSK